MNTTAYRLGFAAGRAGSYTTNYPSPSGDWLAGHWAGWLDAGYSPGAYR